MKQNVTLFFLVINLALTVVIFTATPVNKSSQKFQFFIKVLEAFPTASIDTERRVLTIEPTSQDYCFDTGLTPPFNGAQYVESTKTCTLDYLD